MQQKQEADTKLSLFVKDVFVFLENTQTVIEKLFYFIRIQNL